MSRCYTSEGVHIPGCMGCAALGHAACTCSAPRDTRGKSDFKRQRVRAEERKVSDQRIMQLEADLARLEVMMDSMLREGERA